MLTSIACRLGRGLSNPLVADKFELVVVGFAEPVGTFIAWGDAVEEDLGFVFDLVAGLAHADAGGVEVVFGTGDAEGFLAGVLLDEGGELAVEHPDVVVREGRGLAVAFEGVLEVFEFFFPVEVRVEAEGDVLADFVGFVGVFVSRAVGVVNFAGVPRFGMSDFGQWRKLGWHDRRGRRHVGPFRRPGIRPLMWESARAPRIYSSELHRHNAT